MQAIFGKLTQPSFVIAVVVLFLVLRAMETRNVLGIRSLTTPAAPSA